MDIRKLQRAIVDGLEDVKAQNIAVFNTEHLSPLFERVIIASGNSNRQTKALASSVRDAVKSRGMEVLRTEGEDNGEWIIVDCGAAVAHIMQPAIRDYYHLEEIWGGKDVKMKVGAAKTGLVKASEPEPVRKAAAKSAVKSAAKPRPRVVAKTAKTGKSATPAKKTSTVRQAAGSSARTPAAKSSATRQAAIKTVVVKPAAAKKVAAKKPPVARKTASAKTAVKKTPAKKAPAKKSPPRSR
jgi:ribosome-associated protein